MSAVDFHTHLSDPIAFACRLLRKAVGQGQRVQVRAPTAVLARLDIALWTFSPLDFIAHAGANSPASTQDRSPVLLVDASAPAMACDSNAAKQRGVLVNIGSEFDTKADWVSSHPRVIELVGRSEPELVAARHRYKQYRAQVAQPHTLTIHERTD